MANSNTPQPSAPSDIQQRLEVFKLLVEMADRVSQRRQAANSFYLTVNTAIVGATAYLATLHPHWLSGGVMSVAGLMVCIVWGWNILSYKTLNAAKWQVITEFEKSLAAQPFGDEWSRLDPTGRGKRHTPFHRVEILVPWIFGAVHMVQGLAAIPWATLLVRVCR